MKSVRTLLLAVFVIFSTATAFAHTALVSATPTDGAQLEVAPSEVTLEFNEKLIFIGEKNPNKLEVFDEAGAQISGETEVDGAKVSVKITDVTGQVRVRYHVVSADGHPVEGEYNFSVDSPQVIATPELPESGSNLLIRVIWVFLVLAGIGLFALLRLRK